MRVLRALCVQAAAHKRVDQIAGRPGAC